MPPAWPRRSRLSLSLLVLLGLSLAQRAGASASVLGWRYAAAHTPALGCSATAPCWVALLLTRRVALARFPYSPRALGVAWDVGDGAVGSRALALAARDELAGWEEYHGEVLHA